MLIRSYSDHNPLLVHFDYSLKAKEQRFKFEELWLNYQEVRGVVEKAWNSSNTESTPFAKLAKCIRRTKVDIKALISSVFY